MTPNAFDEWWDSIDGCCGEEPLECAQAGWEAAINTKEEKITPPNTDYAAALSMVKEFEKINGVHCGTYHFAIWLHERLNA